jgi:hypothetical protein
MPSAWVEKRETKSGTRHVVRYRIGGRESALEFGGSFRTLREAKIRRDAIGGDLQRSACRTFKSSSGPRSRGRFAF